MKVLFLLSSIMLGAVGQVFFKFGINDIKSSGFQFFIDLLKNIWIYIGFSSYGFSFLLWMLVLKYYELSFARPFMSIGYIVTYFLAVAFLHESLSFQRIIAILLITVGVFLLSMDKELSLFFSEILKFFNFKNYK